MLWIGNPFGWPKGGPLNQVAMCDTLRELEELRDVVDTITLSAYYLADPSSGNMSNGGLQRAEGVLEVVKKLRQAGWTKIDVMVGNIPPQYGGSSASIDVYRHYTKSAAFVSAVVNEITQQGFDGFNFDFEVSDCNKNPCTVADCQSLASMLSTIKSMLAEKGHPDVSISVDTGQSGLASTGCLNASTADRLISMNTYCEYMTL
jgi:GH18 family chitinase